MRFSRVHRVHESGAKSRVNGGASVTRRNCTEHAGKRVLNTEVIPQNRPLRFENANHLVRHATAKIEVEDRGEDRELQDEIETRDAEWQGSRAAAREPDARRR